MKKLTISLLFALALASAAHAQPKTVLDYYFALPDDEFATNITGEKFASRAELVKFRRSIVTIEDVRNGFLRLEGPWEGWGEVAIFRLKAGGYLVARTSVGCGPACSGSIKFGTYANGKWTDVTARYAPKVTDAAAFAGFRKNRGKSADIRKAADLNWYFLLPREGRTLRVACNQCDDEADDFTLIEYEWNGAAFVRK